MPNPPWWSRFVPGMAAATAAALAQTPARAETPPAEPTGNADPNNASTTELEEDAVHLPPGASTDDPAEGGDSTPVSAETPNDSAGANTEGTTPVPAPTTATPAATPAASTTTPATDAAVTPAATPAASTEQHPVLTAALAGGIDTDAKYTQLSAEAAEGRAALTAGRTDAKAAATARYGAEQPEKLKAAERMIDATNSVEQLSMLTENYLAGAPGANAARNSDGSAKRASASQAPTPGATAEKTPTRAARNAAKKDEYAAYNAPKAA